MNGRYQYDDRRYQYHDIDFYKDRAFDDPFQESVDDKKKKKQKQKQIKYKNDYEKFYYDIQTKNDRAIRAAYEAKKLRNTEEINKDLKKRYLRTEEEKQQFHMRRDEVYQHIMFFRKRFYKGFSAILIAIALFAALFTSAAISLTTAMLFAALPLAVVMFFFLFQKETEFGLYDERITASTFGWGFLWILIMIVVVLALYVVHAEILGGKAILGLDLVKIFDGLFKPLEEILHNLF